MPEPQMMKVSDIPERPRATRPRSSAQQMIDRQVAEFADAIRAMGTEDSVRFHLTSEDDKGFAFSAPTKEKIKDRYRRMFRIAVESAGLNDIGPDHAIEGSYRYHIETLPDNSFHGSGFEVWALKVRREAD